jgi:hypothetical protein
MELLIQKSAEVSHLIRIVRFALRSEALDMHGCPGAGKADRGGLPTEATVAQVLVSKYADQLSGPVDAGHWVGHAACRLRPLHERLHEAQANCFDGMQVSTFPESAAHRSRSWGRLWAWSPTRPTFWNGPVVAKEPSGCVSGSKINSGVSLGTSKVAKRGGIASGGNGKGGASSKFN